MAAEAPVALPRGARLSKVQMTKPPYSLDKGSDITDRDQSYVSQSIKLLRQQNPIKAIRALARFNGTVSTAVFAYVQIALTQYKITAYKTGTSEFDPKGTQLARNIVAQMDTLYDYTKGYSDRTPVEALLETHLKEVALTSGVSAELVLNKFQLPERVITVPVEDIKWKSRGDGTKYPVQSGSGDEVVLDIPTFWIHYSNQSANTFFPRSMFEAALNTAFVYIEFIEDMIRVIRRSGHSRLVAKLNLEQTLNAAPPQVRNDEAKRTEYLLAQKKFVEDALATLNPEDAVVTYDNVEFDSMKTEGEKTEYVGILEALSGLAATSLKSMPSVLGLRIAGSQSLSNTESLVFLKMCKAIQRPVAQLWSRMLTLATRIMGADVYVEFEFAPIELRPELELEAYKTMEQDRILEQLSLGLISDDEAAERLGVGPLPPGYKPLSGTMFHQKSAAPAPSPNNGAQEKALAPKTPANGGGSSNGQ
jgi:hypothetical protein